MQAGDTMNSKTEKIKLNRYCLIIFRTAIFIRLIRRTHALTANTKSKKSLAEIIIL